MLEGIAAAAAAALGIEVAKTAAVEVVKGAGQGAMDRLRPQDKALRVDKDVFVEETLAKLDWRTREMAVELNAVFEMMQRLEAKPGRLDHLGNLHAEHLFREFCSELPKSAKGAPRNQALKMALVRQFDSEAGDAAQRSVWWDLLLGLKAHEVDVLLRLRDDQLFVDHELSAVLAQPQIKQHYVEFDGDNPAATNEPLRMALQATVESCGQITHAERPSEGPGPALLQTGPTEFIMPPPSANSRRRIPLQWYALTRAGRAFVEFLIAHDLGPDESDSDA